MTPRLSQDCQAMSSDKYVLSFTMLITVSNYPFLGLYSFLNQFSLLPRRLRNLGDKPANGSFTIHSASGGHSVTFVERLTVLH